eukprot:SAG31_NODE_42463_length_271_cov_0.906977_1_plen_48_part_01
MDVAGGAGDSADTSQPMEIGSAAADGSAGRPEKLSSILSPLSTSDELY